MPAALYAADQRDIFDCGQRDRFYILSQLLSSGIENIKQALLQTNMSPSTLQTLIYVSVTIVGMLIVSSGGRMSWRALNFRGVM